MAEIICCYTFPPNLTHITTLAC